VWDNCSQTDNDRLENLQLEAARIVTGLTAYSSRDSLYQETGWEKLSSRQERKKLCHDMPHLICVTYYPLWFVMLPTTLFETEMTTLSQDVAYHYTNRRSSRLS
jgi:hypothetical protein